MLEAMNLPASWIILSRCYDAYCTYNLTPDLDKEANPLVSVLGISSWSTLLVIIGLLTIYLIYAYYISVFRHFNFLPSEKNFTFSNIIAFAYLGRKDEWTSIFYKFPRDINRFNHYMGSLASRFLVYFGIISTIMWLLINHTDFYKTVHNHKFIYLILIAGMFVIGYNWNRSLYLKYKEYCENN